MTDTEIVDQMLLALQERNENIVAASFSENLVDAAELDRIFVRKFMTLVGQRD